MSFALYSPMESDMRAGEVLQAMEAAEPTEAAAVLGRLTVCQGLNLARMWTSFKRLLHRRGYFIATPAEVETSLTEIEAIGEGFDLFDLARGLANFDAIRMESLGLHGHRALPELRRFSRLKET